MAKYRGKILVGGDRIGATVEAPNRQAAEEILRRRGKVLEVKWIWEPYGHFALSSTDRHTFLIRLSSMIGSRLGTTQALRLIATTFGGAIQRSAETMLARVEVGVDLASAMGEDPKNFPAETVALVRSGMVSGETWRALRDAADFEYRMHTLRKGSGTQIVQALVTFVIAGIITLASSNYLGPKVLGSDLFKGQNSVDIGWVLVTSNVIAFIMSAMLVAVFTLVFLATVGRRIMPLFSDRVILKVPFYKDIVLARVNHAALYKLGLLIRSGVRVEEALGLTRDGAPRGALQEDLRKAVLAVRAGKSWPVTMVHSLHVTDRASLAVSVSRDDIARSLDILSEQYKDLYIRTMETFAPAAQMVAALFLALSGAIMFGTTLLPMLQLARGISVM